MEYIQDKHKRKALIEATIVMILLIILMFISGMKYLDPPPETGIAVNFGTSNQGNGLVQPQKKTFRKPISSPTKPEHIQPKIREKVLTDENSNAPVIKEKKHKKITKPKKKTPPKKKSKPQPDKNIADLLNSVKNAPSSSSNNSVGEGNDQKSGDKGSINGNPNASGYYGNSGKGSGGGKGSYFLIGRTALTKPKPQFKCNEQGKVVVKIYVNKQGKVIKAIGGMRGTTNLAPCLIKAAEQAAKQTQWSKDSKAPETQIGKIIYNFKIRE